MDATSELTPQSDHPSWSASINSERRIHWEDTGRKPRTFNSTLLEAVERAPSRIQYITADGREVTVSEFYALSRAVAKSLLHLGLQPKQGVGILGFNSVPWFATDIGTTLAGGVPAGIYTTNKPETVAYILKHSQSRAIFVDDEEALEKALKCRGDCPDVSAAILWGNADISKYKEHGSWLHTWDEFLEKGKGVPDGELDTIIKAATPESVAKLIYTSGTTGPPKAVMISHDNITFTVDIVNKLFQVTEGDHLVSYLPVSHIAANSIDVCGALMNGVKVTLARPDALKGTLVETLKKVRPTLFLGVPRVYEKIQENLLAIGAKSGLLKRVLTQWAKRIGMEAAQARNEGEEMMPWGYELAKFLVFGSVRKALGLDQCRIIFNAAAPLQKVTSEYFLSLGIEISDIYGMSEATGPLTCNYPKFRRGTSGRVLPEMEVKAINVDATGQGELCFKGRNIFVGYLNNEKESRETIDEEGFIHSGDLGCVDEDGFVTITGRAKELIVTAGGENVAPALVETMLISAMPAMSRAFVIGDQRKFISCFLVPYMDERGKLIGPATKVNAEVKTVEEAVSDKVWEAYVRKGIEQANEEAISNVARVRNFVILCKDFSIEGGELTPTMKVKRKVVVEKYKEKIDSMYKKV